MRDIMHDAVAEARELVSGVVGDLRQENRLTDDEVLQRYEAQHRGKPWAMVQFAQSQAAAGRDVLEEALRYEQQMEELMRKRGGQ